MFFRDNRDRVVFDTSFGAILMETGTSSVDLQNLLDTALYFWRSVSLVNHPVVLVSL